MICKECGNKIDDNSTFCKFCGYKVSAESSCQKAYLNTPTENSSAITVSYTHLTLPTNREV